MSCGCNKTKKFEVTKSDGSKQVVATQTEAMTLARRTRGTWKKV